VRLEAASVRKSSEDLFKSRSMPSVHSREMTPQIFDPIAVCSD
jgi:hypothetical protein